MKTVQMVVLTNVLFIATAILMSLLWPFIGRVVGYGNSWWVAPLAAFVGFLIAGRVIKKADRETAYRAQLAIFGVFCIGVLVWGLAVENLGIPAWRVTLTLVLSILATWLARAALGRTG
jgi:hypothetical protein